MESREVLLCGSCGRLYEWQADYKKKRCPVCNGILATIEWYYGGNFPTLEKGYKEIS